MCRPRQHENRRSSCFCLKCWDLSCGHHTCSLVPIWIMSPGILGTFEACLRAELALQLAKTVVMITIVLITIPQHRLQHRLGFLVHDTPWLSAYLPLTSAETSLCLTTGNSDLPFFRSSSPGWSPFPMRIETYRSRSKEWSPMVTTSSRNQGGWGKSLQKALTFMGPCVCTTPFVGGAY